MRSFSIQSNTFRLFAISFLILYFELVCIRWLSSYVLYLGFFANFVLLGALLGIGAGAILASHRRRLIIYLPPVLFVFFSLVLIIQPQVQPNFRNFIYFTSSIAWLQIPAYIFLPIIFSGVTTIFTLLSQELGRLLNEFTPLRAYTLNILGSLAGILCFTLFGFLSLPAWVWFLISGILFWLLLPRGPSFGRNTLLLSSLVVVIASSDYAFANRWSPYYRINVIEVRGDQPSRFRYPDTSEGADNYVLFANGVRHQEFTPVGKNLPFYNYPYSAFKAKPDYKNVLVVGAGGGNDVSFALANSVEHVDAVEIDPQIARLGQKYHPEKPYNDPRVSLHIDDARSFLEKTKTQYDLVIYALPDSLIITANTSNIRLESYLFTLEAFDSVKQHLKPGGLFVLYNYYRAEWLLQKITDMLITVFGEPVYYYYVETQGEPAVFATIFTGSKANELQESPLAVKRASLAGFVPATDNWPFLYLKDPSLPSYYSWSLLIILALSGIYIAIISPKGAINRSRTPFFFMGAAFTLLETKSIVNFFLLFGSTWVVNSLVFFAILAVVLIANALAARYKFEKIWILYGLLFLTLILNFAIPLKTFLFEQYALRYVLATVFLFSPIFFANLIYSTTFRDTRQANLAFGANLLGTMLGGATEYLSLNFGYSTLIILAALFYLIAFYSFRRMRSYKAM